ncbi:hypothetical protein [Chitinasiproducens palmae]|uniref:hypothetical protein n=1 Tax=Chitinasiproducens palmae TaxID=1770053 RepID=UPI000B8A161C|nr:hypothetical protein [Chitinasiproducens palmae]
MPAAAEAGTTVDVVSVTSLTVTTREQRPECRPTLVSERQYLFDQANARSWPLRHLKGVTGAPMGAAAGAYLAAHLLSARIWMLPAALVGGAAGWLVGPFGVALGIGGGILGHALTHKLPVTIGGSVAGAGLGMALWQVLFPPPKSPLPPSVTEIPLEHFLTTQECGDASHAQVQPGTLYRVDYYYNGALFFADLPYDPGNRLRVDGDGKPVTTGKQN